MLYTIRHNSPKKQPIALLESIAINAFDRCIDRCNRYMATPKNDRADAGWVARFCRDLKPNAGQPAPAEIAKLQELARLYRTVERSGIAAILNGT